MTNAEFDHKLRDITKTDKDIRPFVCKGSPLKCNVFVVGFNPAKSIPFWDFWHPLEGFQKDLWDAAYLKSTNNKWSPTRSRINKLTEKLWPYASCLETNIYSYSSPDEKSLVVSRRDTKVFKFLIKEIRPKVVFFHGRKATALGLNIELPPFHIKTGKHLRLWSFEAVEKIADEIKSILIQ
jgi:hypothetical protein